MKGERWLLVAPANAPVGDGHFVFLPEARRFAKYLQKRGADVTLALFDVKNLRLQRRNDILRQAYPRPYQHAAVFCHGWESGLQCGVAPTDWVPLLAGPAPCRLTLFACSAGEGPGVGGEGGYADRVREVLCAAGTIGTVLAHRTAGHATLNPTWALFASETPDDGGVHLANFADPKWRAWLKAGEHRFDIAVTHSR